MDPRIRQRLIEVRRQEGRRRLRLVGGVMVALVALVGAFGLARSPALVVRHIRVTGAHHLSQADVIAAAGVGRRRPMTDVHASAMAARLESLPWIQHADVRRRWPSTVAIAVIERTPVVAVAAVGGAVAQVDVDGRVLAVGPSSPEGLVPVSFQGTPGGAPAGSGSNAGGGPVGAPGPPPGPVLAGAPGTIVDHRLDPGIVAAAAMGAPNSSALHGKIATITVGVDGRVSMDLIGGGRAVIGTPEDLENKFVSLATMLAHITVGKRAIDVEIPDAPVLTSEGAGQ